MIPATQRKLRETKFFLSQLTKENQKTSFNEPEAFGFFLSAFLTAARSVTFALQSEEKDKYDSWFIPWLKGRPKTDEELLNFLKVQRNYAEKRGGAEYELDWEFVSMSELSFRSREIHTSPMWGGHVWIGGPVGAPEPQIGLRVHSFTISGKKEEVTAMCSRYVTILEELVRGFIEGHAPVAAASVNKDKEH